MTFPCTRGQSKDAVLVRHFHAREGKARLRYLYGISMHKRARHPCMRARMRYMYGIPMYQSYMGMPYILAVHLPSYSIRAR